MEPYANLHHTAKIVFDIVKRLAAGNLLFFMNLKLGVYFTSYHFRPASIVYLRFKPKRAKPCFSSRKHQNAQVWSLEKRILQTKCPWLIIIFRSSNIKLKFQCRCFSTFLSYDKEWSWNKLPSMSSATAAQTRLLTVLTRSHPTLTSSPTSPPYTPTLTYGI